MDEEIVEAIEDLVHDVEGNDGMNFNSEDEHYTSFEETDFSGLETIQYNPRFDILYNHYHNIKWVVVLKSGKEWWKTPYYNVFFDKKCSII